MDNCQKHGLVILFVLYIILFKKEIVLSVNLIYVGHWSGSPSNVTSTHLCTGLVHLWPNCTHTDKTLPLTLWGLEQHWEMRSLHKRKSQGMWSGHLEETLGRWDMESHTCQPSTGGAAGISTTYRVEDILSYVRPSLKKQKGKKWVKEYR